MKDMLKAGWIGIACAVAVAMTSMAQAQAAAFEGLWIGRTQPKSQRAIDAAHCGCSSPSARS